MRNATILAAVGLLFALVAAQAFGWPELAASGALWAMVPPAALAADVQGELVADKPAGEADQAAADQSPDGAPGDDDQAGDEAGDGGGDEEGKPKRKRARVAVTVKARVLFTGAYGQVNNVATVDPATLKAGVAAGELDPHKDAVAYAEALAAGQVAG